MPSTKAAVAALARAGVSVWEKEPLKEHTTIKIGGPADIFCIPQNTAQLVEALRIAQQCALPVFVLGHGSNLLFNDEGYRGVVIDVSCALAALQVESGRLTAGAGLALADVCKAAADVGLDGLAFAYGIPGSVGGAVYMDAGAYDGEMCQILESVRYLDENLQEQTAAVTQLEMAYRHSVFHAKPWCILSATFQLHAGESSAIWQKMQELMERRRQKQPLELPSAGSAFKRPEGAFAGALIDQCGLRGHRVGGAAISEKHCGFIVNLGDATCRDVLALADHVVKTVHEKTGYVLEKEIQVVP